MKHGQVNLRVPKFQIETSLDMKTTLESLGLGDMFVDSVADFSAMTKSGMTYIRDEGVVTSLCHCVIDQV